MNRIAIIGGTILFEMGMFEGAAPHQVKTDYGDSSVFFKDDVIFLPRHGENQTIPPHRINHQANMAGLQGLGVTWIIGISSVGSLKEEITPDYLLIPDDYINLCNITTFYNERIVHVTPGLSEDLRRIIISSLRDSGEINYRQEGVYIQTMGPRLETKAEIRMLKNFGDVVGMTMASEATAAKELDLSYASLCSIDNLCHGIGKTPLSDGQIRENAKKKVKMIMGVLQEVIEELR